MYVTLKDFTVQSSQKNSTIVISHNQRNCRLIVVHVDLFIYYFFYRHFDCFEYDLGALPSVLYDLTQVVVIRISIEQFLQIIDAQIVLKKY